MLDKVKEAKKILGNRAKDIIARDLNIALTKTDKGLCPFHKEKTPSFTWSSRTFNFHCFGCGINYDIQDHYIRKYGSFQEAAKVLLKETGLDYEIKRVQKKPKTKPLKAEANKETKKAYEYLETRGISAKTCEYARIKEDDKGNIVFEFYDGNNDLELVKYRPPKEVQKGEAKTWAQKGDSEPLLYLMQKADPTKPLLITEGEIDTLSAIESGYRNAVSIPFGAGNYHWINHNFDFLNQFKEIILWPDTDQAGKKMISEVVPRLGLNKVKVVNCEVNDINELLLKNGSRAVLEAIEKAQLVPIKGIMNLSEVESFDYSKAEFLSSGFKGLDKFTNGFLMGSVCVIFGINGSGKTALINQMCICEPLSQNYKVLVYSGEVPRPQLRNIIELPMAGPGNVEEINNGEHKAPTYRPKADVKQLMSTWHKNKIMVYCDDADVSGDTILKRMETAVQRYGVKVVVLDNLAVIDLQGKEIEKYTKQKEFMRKLVNFAKKYNCIVFLATHPRKHDVIKRLSKLDISGTGDISNLAHYVISTHRVSEAEKEDKFDKKGTLIEPGCRFDMLLDVHKDRHLGTQDKSVGLHFESSSKRFYGDSDNKNRNYGWNRIYQQLDWVQEAEKQLKGASL